MIFLSYSRKDIKTMQRIKRVLKCAGIEVWTDENLEPGTAYWEREIDRNLQKCDVVIVLLSQNSYNSTWVVSECSKAKEYDKGIIPLLIGGDTSKSVPLSLYHIQRIDMRKDFDNGITELLKVLKCVDKEEKSPEDGPQNNFSLNLAIFFRQRKVRITVEILSLSMLILSLGLISSLGREGIVLYQSMIVRKVTPTSTPTSTPTLTLTPTSTPTLTLTPEPTFGNGSIWMSEIDGMKMVFVPAGEFMMGSDVGDKNEQPVHDVYLDAFWIDKYEVTNAQYAVCVEANACKEPAKVEYFDDNEYSNHPVVYVDSYQAQNYCEWVGRRLPTEAEWEKAARGTDERTYPWGEEMPNLVLVNYEQNVGTTTAVGSYPEGASPYGVMDMAGNAWEWVADWYEYYGSSPSENPLGPATGAARVLRGGSWYDSSWGIRSTDRTGYNPAFQGIDNGFRCAVSAVELE